MRSTWPKIAGLLLFVLVFFSLNIGGYDLWPPDEPRFAEVAREMIATGDYLVPRVNGEPYKEKPPLLFWAIAVASAPWGDVTEGSARIPSVSGAVFTVLLTYLLARRLYDDRTAFWAAVLLACGVRFWWQSRTGQIDMLLTACVTAAMYTFWRWHESRLARWLLLFYLAIAAGVYAKGPPALVFPVLLVLFFYRGRLVERRRVHLIWGLAAVAGLIAIWLIPARMAVAGAGEGASSDIASNLFRQTVGRMFLGTSKAQWPWYYIGTLAVDWLPWTLFVPWTIPWVWRHRHEGPSMRFLLSWIVPSLIFFSICIGKRAIYILPLFPALAIVQARAILAIDAMHTRSLRRWFGPAFTWAVLLLVLACAPLALRFTEYRDAGSPGVVILGVIAFLFGVDLLWRAMSGKVHAPYVLMAWHFAVLAVLCAFIVFPAINPYKSVREFCMPVRNLAQADADFTLYSIGFSREEYVFYSGRFHTPLMTGNSALEVFGGEATSEQTAALRRLRKTMAKAAMGVTVADNTAITRDEVNALTNAVGAAVGSLEISDALVREAEAAFEGTVAALDDRLAGPGACFAFVQVPDWRCLLATRPALGRFAVVREDGVGHRDVLLIANDRAWRMMTGSS